MWSITNDTPYKAESTWGRDKDGVHEWIVAVKGTFDIKPDGSLTLAHKQLKPLLLPEYHGQDGSSSLRYDSDLVAPKPTTDVVLNGTAYAPKGRPSTDFLVEIRVDRKRKVIRAVGNRRWNKDLLGGKRTATEPVTQIPIVYERAYGGHNQTDPDPKNQRMDSRNPVGCGVGPRPEDRGGLAAPNFEYPKGNLEKAGPAGFGALASHWSPRKELNGTYDKVWEQSRRPLLPVDWDPRSLLCSPQDQRPENPLRGGELVELTNLTPSGHLRFFLPKIHLTFTTYIDGRIDEHRSQVSTVIIEPDFPRVIMVWLSSLICRTDVDYLDETIVREKPYE